MAGFLAFASFFVFAWAVVGLLAPQRVGLKKRVQAIGLSAASVLLAIIAGGLLADTSSPSSAARNAAERLERLEESAWSSVQLSNEWGEASAQGAQSAAVPPLKRMSFPYGDVTGRVVVDCRSVWLRFSTQPNLTGGDIRDGYHVHSLSARIDGNDMQLTVNQNWGSEDLSIRTSGLQGRLVNGARFEVLLPWYGEGNVQFSWDLLGSAHAIAAMNC